MELSNIDMPIAITSVMFLGIGSVALAFPSFTFKLFGVNVKSIEGRNEIRAVYGGMCLSLGALGFAVVAPSELNLDSISPKLAELARADGAKAGVGLCFATIMAGCAFGRIVSVVVDMKFPSWFPWLWFSVEVAMTKWLTSEL